MSTPEDSDTVPGSRMGSGHLISESFGNHLDLRDGNLSQTSETGLLLSTLCLAFPVFLKQKGYVYIIETVNCEDEWDVVWQIVPFQGGVSQGVKIFFKKKLLLYLRSEKLSGKLGF